VKRVVILFISLFAFRLTFGLLHSSWTDVDERQTYLIGLKAYTTGTWPYFGPDVNGAEGDFESQIPGALEGVMIAAPLYVLPIPEAPFILLNLMSTAAVLLLAWYICKRLPQLSFGWLSVWIAAAPWSLHLGTHIYGPDYIFLPSVLFVIGFMESVPAFRLGVIGGRLANALMGLSLFWVMQFHFSYVYLVPLAMVAVVSQGRAWWSGAAFFAAGAAFPLAFLVPTLVKYGLASNNVASGFAVPFNWDNVAAFPTILARFLSMVSFELPRFLGNDSHHRLAFLREHWLLAVPAIALGLIGVIQPFVLLAGWFMRSITGPGWRPLRWLVVFALVMAEVSFWFTIKRPLSHIYFVFFPLLMVYACYCWAHFAERTAWRMLAKIFVVTSVVFQLGYAVAAAHESSLYMDRATVLKAIQERDYRLLGERRTHSRY